MLTNSDSADLTAFRRALHRRPEVSGQEAQTAATIARALGDCAPDKVLTGLGGHGVAAVWDSGAEGPTVLFRAELDALPIEETGTPDWASEPPGTGHLCGHDGHMTILAGLARLLSRRRPTRGRAVLMFQPAEETGAGARAVTSDPAYAAIAPDWAFAIHNLPGVPVGTVALRAGLVNCASQGLRITLTGRTAHAADPGAGLSPAGALARLIPVLDSLGPGGAVTEEYRLTTLTHARLGEPTFGVAPGEAMIHLTLRAARDDALADLVRKARVLAEAEATDGLTVRFENVEAFAARVNDPEATGIAARAVAAAGLTLTEDHLPMTASEDFGLFGHTAKSAMLYLGPGAEGPALHNPDYDFNDDLIPQGVRIFDAIADDLLR